YSLPLDRNEDREAQDRDANRRGVRPQSDEACAIHRRKPPDNIGWSIAQQAPDCQYRRRIAYRVRQPAPNWTLSPICHRGPSKSASAPEEITMLKGEKKRTQAPATRRYPLDISCYFLK